MLEDHATDFVEKWKTGFGMYGEQGGESIHNEFNQLKITYCRMQTASRRLQSMLQEHYKSIHPESKAAQFKNKFSRKRKTILQHISQELNNSQLQQLALLARPTIYSYNLDLDLISASNLKTLIALMIALLTLEGLTFL